MPGKGTKTKFIFHIINHNVSSKSLGAILEAYHHSRVYEVFAFVTPILWLVEVRHRKVIWAMLRIK